MLNFSFNSLAFCQCDSAAPPVAKLGQLLQVSLRSGPLKVRRSNSGETFLFIFKRNVDNKIRFAVNLSTIFYARARAWVPDCSLESATISATFSAHPSSASRIGIK